MRQLLKAIVALLLIAWGLWELGGSLGLGWVLLAVVLLVLAWSLWFVATIERHFADNKRLAAKGIDPDYDGDGDHSNRAP